MKNDGGHTQADVSISAFMFAAKLKSRGGFAAKLKASADAKAVAGGSGG